MSDMVPSDGRDQPIPYPKDMMENMENMVDTTIEKCIKDQSPDEAFAVGIQLLVAGHMSGMAFAKLVYELKKVWSKFGISERFEDVAYSRWGRSKLTLERYLSVWEMRASGDIPAELQAKIEERDLKDQIAIASTWGSYNLTPDHWEKLADAVDNGEVRQILQEVKGVPARDNSITIKLERDGTLRAWNKGQGIYIGHLAVEESEENDVVRKAIHRIVNNSEIRIE